MFQAHILTPSLVGVVMLGVGNLGWSSVTNTKCMCLKTCLKRWAVVRSCPCFTWRRDRTVDDLYTTQKVYSIERVANTRSEDFSLFCITFLFYFMMYYHWVNRKQISQFQTVLWS